MSDLLTIEALRALVACDLDDTQLGVIIDREEAEIVSRYGANYDGTAIVEVARGGLGSLYLKRRIVSVTSIAEASTLGGTPTTLAASAYHIFALQGRIVRLPSGAKWACDVEVTYVPADDSVLRQQVLIELVRLAIEQTAMKGESIAGEHSYTAPEWELTRKRLYKRLEFASI